MRLCRSRTLPGFHLQRPRRRTLPCLPPLLLNPVRHGPRAGRVGIFLSALSAPASALEQVICVHIMLMRHLSYLSTHLAFLFNGLAKLQRTPHTLGPHLPSVSTTREYEVFHWKACSAHMATHAHEGPQFRLCSKTCIG